MSGKKNFFFPSVHQSCHCTFTAFLFFPYQFPNFFLTSTLIQHGPFRSFFFFFFWNPLPAFYSILTPASSVLPISTSLSKISMIFHKISVSVSCTSRFPPVCVFQFYFVNLFSLFPNSFVWVLTPSLYFTSLAYHLISVFPFCLPFKSSRLPTISI